MKQNQIMLMLYVNTTDSQQLPMKALVTKAPEYP